MKKFNVGDSVMINRFTSFGDYGIQKVTAILTKYNENTGKPYEVICFGKWQFSAVTGAAITEPYMYYIDVD